MTIILMMIILMPRMQRRIVSDTLAVSRLLSIS